ncbi:hypothetical protein V7O66_12430 [Methanolobus sp. ZRKC3]
MDEKVPEKKEKKEDDDEGVAKVSPIRPGDSRGHARRHLLDTCE